MKLKRKIGSFFSLLVFVSLVLFVITFSNKPYSIEIESTVDKNNFNPFMFNSKIKTVSYQSHDLIDINSDLEFAFLALPANEDWPGDGSAFNPYIIERYNITIAENTLINISDTTVHFVIRDCYLQSGGNVSLGIIDLMNVQNAIIENNTIVCDLSLGDSHWDGGSSEISGINIFLSQNVNITNNRIYNCTDDGLDILSSTDFMVLNNLFDSFKGSGIDILGSSHNFHNNTIISEDCFASVNIGTTSNSNILDNNSLIGESLLISGDFNNITNNIIQGYNSGIEVWFGNNNTFFRNSVIDGWDGITIHGAENNTVFNNSICNTFEGRFEIDSSSYNTIVKWNNFWDYSDSLYSGGEDNGNNNIVEENYWSDHSNIDSNFDGFADDVYNIAGSSSNQDPFPLASPNLTPLPHHLVTTPYIYSPSGVRTVSGTITIEWDVSIDLLTHNLTYSVYYSPNNGSDWIILISELPQGIYEYLWDTTTVPDGNGYMVRVIAKCSEGNSANATNRGRLIITNTNPDRSNFEAEDFLKEIIPYLGLVGIIGTISLASLYFINKRRQTSSKSFDSHPQKSLYTPISPESEKFITKCQQIDTMSQTTSLSTVKISNIFEITDEWSDRQPFLIFILSPIFWIISHILFPPSVRKLTSEKVFENPMRKKILEILEEVKFEHFNVLRNKLNCGVSILKWHLQVLEDFKLVKSKRVGKYTIFHLSNFFVDESKVILYCSLRSIKALELAKFFLKIKITPINLIDLSVELEMNRETLRYHCNKFVELHILSFNEKDGTFLLVAENQRNLLWLLNRYKIS